MSEAERPSERTSVSVLGALAIAVVIATLSVFYLISVATAMVDRARYYEVIAQAADSGALAQTHRLPFGSGETVAIHNFNDCLILSMLILPQDPNPLLRALSPNVPADVTPWSGVNEARYPPYVQCRDLAAAMASPDAVPTSAYHRYLHGDWVLAKALLAILPLSAGSNAMALLVGLLLLCPAAFAARTMILGTGAPSRERAYLALSLTLFSFSALPAFAWSFSFAPSDLVIAGALLFFYLRPPSSLTDRTLVFAAALFGTLTALFEFLTGAAPMGLMAVIAVIAFDDGSSVQQVLRRLLIAAISFGGAIVLSFAIKMSAVAMIWGVSELGIFGRQIGAHMNAGGWDIASDNADKLNRLGLSADTIRQSVALSYGYALSKVVYFTKLMAFGSVTLGAVLAVILPLALACLAAWELLRSQDALKRLRIALVLGGCFVMPVWYLAFIHHTIVHAHFMFRPMVWPLALLVAMQAWLWRASRKKLSAPRLEPGRLSL